MGIHAIYLRVAIIVVLKIWDTKNVQNDLVEVFSFKSFILWSTTTPAHLYLHVLDKVRFPLQAETDLL